MIAIERYLDVLTPFARTPYLRFLVEISLARILHRRQEPVETLLDRHRTEIAHVADWLTASVANDAPWLLRTDERSRPRKLMKLGSLEQAVHEADKAMRIASQRSRSTLGAEPVPGVEHVVDLPDGYSIVRLASVEALDRESAFMGHCVGNGAYDELLATDRFYSLVDRRGRPHATMHVNAEGAILQIKGRANTAILPRYARMILPWINENGMTVEEETHLCRLVVDEVGTIHSIDDLPEGCVVDGSLVLPAGVAFPSLPRNLTILGSLVGRPGVDVLLPEDLTIHGDLILTGSPISTLPEGLVVDRDAILARTGIERLPGTFRIGRSIDLVYSALVELPDDLVVHGNLEVDGTPLPKLPRNLRVEGSLSAVRGQFEEIADDVFVGGGIGLSHSAIQRLPANFHARKELDLSFTEIRALPKGLVVEGRLVMNHCAIGSRSLPSGTRIGSGLLANWSWLRKLPRNLEISGDVDLSQSDVERLPSGMRVAGTLALNGTHVRELPEDLKVGGQVSLPDGFEGDTHGLEIAGRPSMRTP